MKWLLVAALLLVALAGGYAAFQRTIARLAEESERKALEAVQKAREDVSASMQPLRDQGARLRRDVEQAKAEVQQARSAASAAAIQTEKVHDAGETLRRADVADVLAACARQGYTCRVVR